jgi:hypothetical protein
MRKLRKPLQPGTLVEVTTRTVQGRLLMVPEPTLNRSILGVLGRAQRLYPVQIHAYVFAGNHYHLLLTVDDAYQLAAFTGYLNSNLAREIAHLTNWTDKIWSRRYESIEVSGEEEVQAARMKYLLAHGPKEALVERPEEWPGVHCVSPLLSGQATVEGTWYDRTRESVLHRSRKPFTEEDYTQQETVTLTPIPCWKRLTPESYSSQIRALVDQITTEAAAERARTGRQPLGVKAVLRQKPGTKPEKVKKSPAPYFHALRKSVRKALYEAYFLFVAEYRDASEKLRSGDRTASFPLGCFPPALPFVSAIATPAAA